MTIAECYNPDNGLASMPTEWLGQFWNACTEPCDMLIGPCACGAWHHLYEWPKDVRDAMIAEHPQSGETMWAYLDENPHFKDDIGYRRKQLQEYKTE
jgi:hypothetical protein